MNTATQNLESTRVSSVLRKAAMAVTGAALAVWVTLHMLGVLTVFGGPGLMNGYAQKFRDSGVLWPMRVGLLALVTIHVACAVSTSLQAYRARPQRYAVALRSAHTTFAARSMRFGGVFLVGYLIYHVSQIHGGVGVHGYVAGDVYHNLLAIVRQPLSAAIYLGATAWLALHLAHGLGSALITLGFVARRRAKLVTRGLVGWAWVVTCGFAVETLAGLFGLVH